MKATAYETENAYLQLFMPLEPILASWLSVWE